MHGDHQCLQNFNAFSVVKGFTFITIKYPCKVVIYHLKKFKVPRSEY